MDATRTVTMTSAVTVDQRATTGAPRRGCAEGPTRGLRDLPGEERPRERLARCGAAALSTRELLAVLLGTGSRRRSVLDMAEDLAASGLRDLAGRTLPDLEQEHGLGRAKAARLLAAMELGGRAACEAVEAQRPSFRSPEESARFLLPRYATRPVEVFGLLAVDVRHRLKREAVVSVGSLSGSVVHPREVFAEAIACRAAGVILFHNHPSGDPEPSEEDLALTRRLVAGGSLLGIEVLDHLILGAGRFVSLKTRGLV
jgi:DNA repair protein RadC